MIKKRFIRIEELCVVLSVSKSTIRKRVRDGLFVPPIKIIGRASGFITKEVDQMVRLIETGATEDHTKATVCSIVKKRDANKG